MYKLTKEEAIKRFDVIYDSIEKAYAGYARAHGLNTLSFTALRDIYESDKTLSQKELSQKHETPKQIINNIVKGFLADGIVTLQESSDRRFKKIALTAKGKEFAQSIFEPLAHAENHLWDNASADEVIAVVKLTEMYADGINALTVSKK